MQVRRQGRNFGTGEVFSFKRPQSARSSAATGRELNPSAKSLNRVEAAPVFNLNDMLKKEAAKLKAKVQEASLAAAKAAEEAEQKLEEMVEKVMDETDATREEVENIVSIGVFLNRNYVMENDFTHLIIFMNKILFNSILDRRCRRIRH